jgi:hypothetical protein
LGSIATDYRLMTKKQCSCPGRVKNFLFSTLSRRALGSTQPPIQWVPGALSPRVKQLVREAHHSPPTSAQVRKLWTYTSVGTSHNTTGNPTPSDRQSLLLQTPSDRQSLLLRSGIHYSQKHTERNRYLYSTNQPISVHNSSTNRARTPIG